MLSSSMRNTPAITSERTVPLPSRIPTLARVRPIEVLFVDKGAVLIDNNEPSPQWRRRIGEWPRPTPTTSSSRSWTRSARDLFDRVYGSALVNTWKFGPEYYRAVLAESGVDPDRPVTGCARSQRARSPRDLAERRRVDR